ncbi:hypothetical protein GQ53DRAFT_750948 [Thozetella sp. PMI_491]|nr:hypothetical protein GQ53DRAFT_750948 [Thozetella sp. PMI_491]
MARWREYLDYISTELQKCDDRISIHKPLAKFNIDLSSKQRVHNLRKKLHHASSILSNTASTLQSIGMHAAKVGKMDGLPSCAKDSFQHEVENLSSELKNYRETTNKLLKRSADIQLMYNDILKLRGQEIQCQNGASFTQISKAQAREAQIMASLAEKSFQDARTMRITTIVAMIYLPANLVLAFFSSTLVWFEDNIILRVHSETWIAVLTTLILAASTIYASVWWIRREKRLDLEKTL